MKARSGKTRSMPGTVGSPNVRPRSTISHLPRQPYRLTFIPISPDPPSGRKISSSPGTMICKLLAGGIAPMDQRQPLDCEIAIDMIEAGGVLFEQKRRSEERRVGKECVSTYRSRRSQTH